MQCKLALAMYRWALLCQLASWFNGYCLVRTYSNSFEALCTVAGVYYWLCSFSSLAQTDAANNPSAFKTQHSTVQQNKPLQSKAASQADEQQKPTCPFQATLVATRTWNTVLSNTQKWLLAAAIGVLFRPSSMLFWVPVGKSYSSGFHVNPCMCQVKAGV